MIDQNPSMRYGVTLSIHYLAVLLLHILHSYVDQTANILISLANPYSKEFSRHLYLLNL